MKNVLIIIGLLTCQAGMAQTIKGHIFSSDLSRAAFAEVELWQEPIVHSLHTDANGFFQQELVMAGTYRLTVKAKGHEPYVQEIVANAGAEVEVIVYLRPSITNLNGVRVSSVRAGERSPSTAVTLDKKQLISLDQSKDFPFLLDQTPSTVISSDAGNGIGYTGVRIRGIDPTRVNVTINDVPLNDAESQGVFWVDLPDLASSTQSVQIQRGIGTSTNGVAAFGASINVQTDGLPLERNLSQSLAFGSFGTRRISLHTGTGELESGWNVQSRISYIGSEGFIDRAGSELLSGQLNVRKQWNKTSVQANLMLGHERTYQAWWGIPQPKFQEDAEGVMRYIADLGMSAGDSANLVDSDPDTYNYYTYENEVDDYSQNHLQLLIDHQLGPQSRLRGTLHYTRGNGYFEQYMTAEELLWFEGQDLSSYGIGPYIVQGDTLTSTDLVRRRWLDNHFYGAILHYHWSSERLEVVSGGSANQYLGRHYGEAIQTFLSETEPLTDYESLHAIYYDEDATKNDLGLYAKATYQWGSFFPYLDLQFRGVDYRYLGYNEGGSARVPQQSHFQFFNPKIGLSYLPSPSFRASLFFAMANREPIRSDFVDSRPGTRPKPEQMQDLELNLQYRQSSFQMDLTLYAMEYTDALVLNGQLNDVGAYTRINVDAAYRRGLELGVLTRPAPRVDIGGNVSFSDNRIADFTEYVDDWYNGGQVPFTYRNTAMALSPTVIASGLINMRITDAFELRITSKYVSKQYLDNTENEERMLPAFNYLNAQLSYAFRDLSWTEELGLDLFLNNIGNQRFAPSGYTFSGMLGERADFNYVYPMAGFNGMFKLRMAF